jgi:crotonobetainyl-CoA:carnitine CoA-transferase CaiB-like acyl-CoA transferase
VVKVDDGIGTMTFNRPEKRNAMNPRLHAEMNHALDELIDDETVRVIILTGAGEDARFKDRPGRVNNFQQLIDVLRPVFATRPRGYWSERLTAHDVPNVPVHSIPEAMQNPEVRDLKLFHQMEHPRYGSLTALHRPPRLNGERESDPLPPPALGEHSEPVLPELGFAPLEIAALRSEKIL